MAICFQHPKQHMNKAVQSKMVPHTKEAVPKKRAKRGKKQQVETILAITAKR